MPSIKSLLRRDWFIGLVITILFLYLAEAGWMAALDRQAYNFGVKFSAAKEPHEDIVVVAIDDKSIQALGAWPWSREVLAKTTRLLSTAKPSVMGFTIPFDTGQYGAGLSSLAGLRAILSKENKLSKRVNKALRRTEVNLHGDKNLAGSFKSGGRIVLAMPYTPTEKPLPGLSPSLPQYMQKFALPKISANGGSRGFGWPSPKINRASEISPPIELLAKQAGGIGVISFVEPFNSEPLIVQYGSDYLPSFSLMLAARSKGMSVQHIESRAGARAMLGGDDLGADMNFGIYPRFYIGKDGKSAFKIYSLIDVLNGSVATDVFRDKIIIVGMTSPGIAQPHLTPTGQAISSTVAIAHTVSSLLNNEQYRLPDWAGWAQRGIIVVVGLYLMLVMGRFRPNTALFLSLFLILIIFNAHFMLMSSQSLWLPMMSAVVMLIVGHLILGTRQSVNARLSLVRGELSTANRLLGQSLHAQGNLDQAFAKYRSCQADESLLGQVYNLGLDYERKRQFNKAAAVFKFISDHDAKFSDVSERIQQNENAANTVVLGNRDATGPGPNLISGADTLEKPKLGRYRIESEIGRGAMGMVYLGQDDKIGRTVAIKTMLLSDEIEDDMRDEVRTRFFREAEAAGRLDHPGIVTVYDVGDEQDLAYIAMDYLKGKDLTAYTSPKTLLPVSEVFNIIINVATALDYAHQQHVVHRDIKPANIIYDDEKRVAKITDFGVACLTDASKTKTGTVIGSPYYMSPEQLAGKKVDGRADLFSLGVMMFQMLCGELPFKGDSIASLMYNIANERHPDIRRFRSDLPNCVNNLIDRILEKEAQQRFESGQEMADTMKLCQEHIREMEAA
ncbi:MAG: serine/threonine-protein kinase [Gammaproteobacteria bacterium]|nr:serine/threonine-protein kinase [Gammaproteobacteria bacterium]